MGKLLEVYGEWQGLGGGSVDEENTVPLKGNLAVAYWVLQDVILVLRDATLILQDVIFLSRDANFLLFISWLSYEKLISLARYLCNNIMKKTVKLIRQDNRKNCISKGERIFLY